MEDVTVGLNKYTDMIVEWLLTNGPNFLLSIIVLIVGFKLVEVLIKIIDRTLRHQKVEESLRGFLESLVSVALKIMVLITVASMIGVQMTSFVALLGAAGLAIGLSLQGSLGNLAGGVLILFFKPFKVKDLIEAQGHMGIVKKIEIFNTILTTLDHKTVILPNGALSNGAIVNYTNEPIRRVDLTFGIGYDDDIKKARDVMMSVIKKDKRVLKDPQPLVAVKELADSSVNFEFRVWCKTEEYWNVYFDMTEAVKIAFDENKISIPFPQRDVHLHQK